MADPNRIRRLRAQRELIAEHLAWLDAEIEQATGSALAPDAESENLPASPPPVAAANSPLATPPRAETTTPVAAPAKASDELLEELVQEYEAADKPLSKTGCWVIFSTIVAVVVGAAVIVIYAIYS
ncbi:hypothetical protein [Synoicihabitans lomoniglobus]|uniref:Uncharacterized protein n=1 Tax=Synoicihabitans lomoniglobus TaxID=2909285 RepID=A0AAF0CS75_9BACT|nr:hypothetical protein [Opitutaceae bacterium LMO-M01]WED67026.1 hypothetical protein PXH66_09205 [Opitutaceae bacterium LMO-M01]